MNKKPFWAIFMLFLTTLCFSQSLNVLNQGNPVLGSDASTIDLVQDQDGVYYLPYILNGTLGVKTSANGESFEDGVVKTSLTEFTPIDFKITTSFGSNYLVLLANVSGANHLYLFLLEKNELRQVVEAALDNAAWGGSIDDYIIEDNSSAMIIIYLKSGNLGAFYYNPQDDLAGTIVVSAGTSLESFTCQKVSKFGEITLYGLTQSSSVLYQFEIKVDLTSQLNLINEGATINTQIVNSMTGQLAIVYENADLIASYLVGDSWKPAGVAAVNGSDYQTFMIDDTLYTLIYRTNNGIEELILSILEDLDTESIKRTEIIIDTGIEGKGFLLPQSLTLFTIGVLKADGTVSMKDFNCVDNTLVDSSLSITPLGFSTSLQNISYAYGQRAIIEIVQGIETDIISIHSFSPGNSEIMDLFSRNVSNDFQFENLGKGLLLFIDDASLSLFNLSSGSEINLNNGIVVKSALSLSDVPFLVVEGVDGIKIYQVGAI